MIGSYDNYFVFMYLETSGWGARSNIKHGIHWVTFKTILFLCPLSHGYVHFFGELANRSTWEPIFSNFNHCDITASNNNTIVYN